MKRKILMLILISCLCTLNVNASRFKFIFKEQIIPTFSEQSADRIYCDTEGHWCTYSAERLYNEDIFTGIKIGKNYYFMPEEYITRGEFLLYLDTVVKTPSPKSLKLPFADAGSIPGWQFKTVCSMYEVGYIKGNTEGENLYFNYDEKISRMECALVLNNVLGLKNKADATDYYDNYLIPQYAVTGVKNVTDYGIMQGYTDNSFRPYVKMNRAMLADVLCKVKDYLSNNK